MYKETKREKFKRLVSKRTTNVLNQLRLIGNLANKVNYDYSDEDVRKVFRAIEDQFKTVKAKFETREKKEFKL